MERNFNYLARFIVEAATPLAIGSGEKGMTVDRLIMRDANDLPYIPGTSLAGVLRHALAGSTEDYVIDKLFGFQEGNDGQGSRICISNAHLLSSDGETVIEGLQEIDQNDDYYGFLHKLPERDHVRMTHRGVADTKGHGKYDEELVHKGVRFVFDMEISGTENDTSDWTSILNAIHQPFFRIGAGTRKGFGQLKFIESKNKVYNLTMVDDLKAYLNRSSSLNASCHDWNDFATNQDSQSDWTHYQLFIKPESSFLFAAGYGDEDAEMIPKTDRCFEWSDGIPKLTKKQEYLLIPATSVKGALSHRVAFHYNKITNIDAFNFIQEPQKPVIDVDKVIDSFSPLSDSKPNSSDSHLWNEWKREIDNLTMNSIYEKSSQWKRFEENLEDIKEDQDPQSEPVGENNEAVKALFGFARTDDDGARGHVIFSDIYLSPNANDHKIFNHVKIDRFTGGAVDGALFEEKVATSELDFTMDIYVQKSALNDSNVKMAFELALEDIVTGQLPLGGSVAKGHGTFLGKWDVLPSNQI